MDRPAAERAIRDFLSALGRSGAELEETPERVASAFADELLSGYGVDVERMLADGSEPAAGATGIIVVSDISVATVCPHHLLPGLGRATVAYEPGSRILGLGVIARLVDAHARRLTLQESIGANVTRSLVEQAGARGAYCELSLLHTCLATRGARQPEATVRTVATAGSFDAPEGRAQLALALREGGGG